MSIDFGPGGGGTVDPVAPSIPVLTTQKFANAARAYLVSGVSDSATTVVIDGGGSLFPAITAPEFSRAVLQDANGIEIVLITAHTAASDSFTVTRGQEGTTARAFAAGSVFGIRMTAADGDTFVAKVSGPSLSTDNAVALFDGTTGKAVKNSALTFDGTNVINSGAYTAPSNAAGPGTKTTIQGSTGTGQAGASGGNGFIELIGGGGTSIWTSFAGLSSRRRGGINIQAGTAQGDAGGTFVSGSNINILGSSGTNNGTSTGLGSQILISSGSVSKIDGQTNGGASVNLTNSGSLAGSSVSITAGNFSTSMGGNGGAQVSIGSGNSTSSGSITLSTGFVGIAGSTAGKAFVNTAGVSSEILTTASTVAVANGGTGATSLTANNVILGNGTSAVQEVAPGFSGNVLISDGTTWTSSSIPQATPTSLGSVFGRVITNGDGTAAFGYQAFGSNTDIGETRTSAAFGNFALFSATTGQGNTAVGSRAAYSIDTGSSNTAVGSYALYSAVVAAGNVAVGSAAATNTTTGSFNVAVGADALRSNKTAGELVAIGTGALRNSNDTTAPVDSRHTAVGGQALRGSATAANNTGVNNTAIGHSALKDYTSGSQNTALGINAGLALTTGSNNTILGANAAASSPTVSNEVTVGNASVTSFRVPGIGLTWTASGLPAANGGTGLTSPGTSGNVLTSNGTAWTSAALPAGGLEYVYKTANYTALDKEGVLADTSGGAFTVTLPATPSVGAQVVVADAGNNWGTNNLTVARNGSTIGGLAEDLVCDITGASVQFVYDGSTWEVYAQIGGQGGSVVTLDGVQTLTNKTMDFNSNTFTNFPAATPFSNNTSLAQVQATALCF